MAASFFHGSELSFKGRKGGNLLASLAKLLVRRSHLLCQGFVRGSRGSEQLFCLLDLRRKVLVKVLQALVELRELCFTSLHFFATSFQFFATSFRVFECRLALLQLFQRQLVLVCALCACVLLLPQLLVNLLQLLVNLLQLALQQVLVFAELRDSLLLQYRGLFELPVSKETYYSVKRDLLQCQKRPTTVSKETYYSVKRDLQYRGRFELPDPHVTCHVLSFHDQ